ncbi:hypothetical protein N9L68_07980 [bacterium]|nr:hypothetical protein [bacterium]
MNVRWHARQAFVMDLKRLTGQNWKTPFGAVVQPPAAREPKRARLQNEDPRN